MPTPGYAPPGWPDGVRPPGVPGWEAEAVEWLFDWSPPSWRQDPVLTRHPVVLARFALAHLQADVAAARRAWTLSAEPRSSVDNQTWTAVLDMLARVGPDLNRRVIAAELLHDAFLHGRLWTPRL